MSFSSDALLLSTKLKIPAPRRNYICRKALFEKLSDCIDMGVVFISGGAGTGKTTLLTSFIREAGLKNVCWVSMDASNANVYSFWMYFTAAASAFWEEDEAFLDIMRANPDPSHMEGLLIMLINRLCSEEDYYMVLDDVQYIKDEVLIKTLEFFLKSMPANFHLFFLSREDPPVYLGPLVMSGRFLYIDGKQMKLSFEEGMSFLRDTLKLTEGEEELAKLNKYAEGWIGGLQLSVAAGQYSGQFLRAGGGIAAEYLTHELFESLAEREKTFLVRTSFLSYFDAAICIELLEDYSVTDFEEMVEELIRKNLFIVCIDEENRVYRYHNILTEYLAEQFKKLSDKQKKELYKKAAAIFLERGDFEEALGGYYAAREYDSVLSIAKDMDGRIEAWGYLDKVPVDKLMSDADLAAQCFMYNLGNMNMERCRVLYDKFREYYGDSDIFHIVQFAEGYITHSDLILPEYHALSAAQIECLPFGQAAKAMILVENSAALIEQMEYGEAENCALKAIQTSKGINIFVEFFGYTQLAQVYEEIGRMNDSLACYVKADELFCHPSMMSGVGTSYYFGLVGIYMRRMELEEAKKALEDSRALMNSKHIRMDVARVTLIFHEAELSLLYGDKERCVLKVEEILKEYPNLSRLTLGRLIYELDCIGKLPKEIEEKFIAELETASSYRAQPFMRLLRARLLFKRGESGEAFKETDDIMTFSRLHKNKLRLIEAGLLKVVMLSFRIEKTLRHREIDNLLKEAIHYAWEDRILMPFYLEREAIITLLKELFMKEEVKATMPPAELSFLKDILNTCGVEMAETREPETLSERETEVLMELAQGITNREIAERLCISQATVKTHVLSIFGKLGVSSRMMAVEEGRKKGLISR
ncbi:LuxR C-terminal-related transcriptional regulator [Anaerocolumna xylanovorans]|uniref:LuxR family transcriptional regulator, maltose regulon positive regulatory protein n=1 Tax=Anaerocolumna xylanovorans DSM 12503 TaxID=1121345 RepID=A0A1M7Y6Y4_9FIRM|nr:LuxR C-terminal-related transcriptional regulator [Anaerocolumna xylanovorans]SHO48403.1 LuxR family transcriptional regulator, maltose regulon positive regulatory protein [Anaerocolumna xylanovorans DSM 12503]